MVEQQSKGKLLRRVSLSRLNSGYTERTTSTDFLKPIEEMKTRERGKTYGGGTVARPVPARDVFIASSRKRVETLSPVRYENSDKKNSDRKANDRKNTGRSASKISDRKSVDRSPDHERTEALISSLDEFTNNADEETRSVIKDDAPSPIQFFVQPGQPEVPPEKIEKITLDVPRTRPKLKKLKLKRNSIVSMTQDHQLKAIYTSEKSVEKSNKQGIPSRKSVGDSGLRKALISDETKGSYVSTDQPILTTLMSKELQNLSSPVKIESAGLEEIPSAKMITYSVRKPDRNSSNGEGLRLEKRATSLPRIRPSRINLQKEFIETTKCYQNRVRSQEKKVMEVQSATIQRVGITDRSDYIRLADKFSAGLVDRKAYESKAESLYEGILKGIRTSLETARKEETEMKGKKKKKLKKKDGTNKSLVFLPSIVYDGKMVKKVH